MKDMERDGRSVSGRRLMQPIVVPILGMHRSGTSLVSSICHDIGVYIGDELLGSHPSQPHGHWEDIDFYSLNERIFRKLGCTWIRVPSLREIKQAAPIFEWEIATLLNAKSTMRPRWGWKDPRTCVTFPLYRPFLPRERTKLVIVRRGQNAILESLVRRSGGGSKRKWLPVLQRYNSGIEWAISQGIPYVTMRYELLVESGEEIAEEEIRKLVVFVDSKIEFVEKAMKRIKFR